MKKCIAILFVLAGLNLSTEAGLDGNNVLHHYRVVLGNTGPMPWDAFRILDGKMKRWDTGPLGPQPSRATLISYDNVKTATRAAYDNERLTASVAENKRLRRLLKMVLKQFNVIRVELGMPLLEMVELTDPN